MYASMDQFEGLIHHLPLSATDPEEIRIVYLDLNSWDSPLECILRHISLCKAEKEVVSYIALSYVWGDARETTNITLDGLPFPVTLNLFNALKRIRSSFQDVLNAENTASHGIATSQFSIPLWIDALCINQLDLVERALQVTRMAEIYSKASRVIAYIGGYDSSQRVNVDLVFNLCDEMSNEAAHIAFGQAQYKAYQQKDLSSSRVILDALKKLYLRPYFHRIWVVQETTAQFYSTVVMWGDRATKLEYLKKLSKSMILAASYLEDSLYQALSLQNNACFSLVESFGQNRPADMEDMARRLSHLLSATGDRNATDRRDRMYGLLGLLGIPGTDLPSILKPSYEKPLEQVYYDYTRWLLEHTSDVTLIEGLPIERTWAPSWVTDLNHPSAGNFDAMGLPYISSTKSGFRQPPLKFSNHGRTLHIHAIPLGVVVTVQEGLPFDAVRHDGNIELWFDAFEARIVRTLEMQNPHLTRDEILDLIFPTRLGLGGFKDIYKMASSQAPLSEEVLEELEVRHWNMWGAHWFILDDDSVWLSKVCSPEVPVRGDAVYLMIGSSHATILRPDMETNTWTQIINCFGGRLQNMLLDLSVEDWSEMHVEEILLS